MENTFNFSKALYGLKNGRKIARSGWHDDCMWLTLVANYNILDMYEDTPHQDDLVPWIGMKTADNKFVPWLASQTDVLANDWVFIE